MQYVVEIFVGIESKSKRVTVILAPLAYQALVLSMIESSRLLGRLTLLWDRSDQVEKLLRTSDKEFQQYNRQRGLNRGWGRLIYRVNLILIHVNIRVLIRKLLKYAK